MRNSLIISAAILSLFATSTFAEPALRANDIVEHFIKSAKLGEARAICIGTAQECANEKGAPLEALNMSVNFEYNSATLTPEAFGTLKEFAIAINDRRLGVASFKVEGHTDAYGTDIFNMQLSEQRAKAVSDTLVSFGVAPSRIESKGYGETRLVSSDAFAAENRRVEARMVLPKE